MKMRRPWCAGGVLMLACVTGHFVPEAEAAAIFPTPTPAVVATPVFNTCLALTPRRTYLKASNTGGDDEFGGGYDGAVAVSADGMTLAVGVEHEDSSATGVGGNQGDNSATDSGAVYVFVRSGLSWVQQAYIKASNTEAEDAFGRSVALSADGNTLVVGAPHEDSAATGVGGDQTDNSVRSFGAAYVFTRSGQTWTQQTYLKAWDVYVNSASFGQSVAITTDGNLVAVGAPCTNNCSGAVFLFSRSGTSWYTDIRIEAPSTFVATQFGKTVAISGQGGTIAIGAPYDDSGSAGINGVEADTTGPGTGSVYVYTRVVISPVIFSSKQAYIKASDVDDYDYFGQSIALSENGNVLAVGAPHEDGGSTGTSGDPTDDSVSGSGAAYIFTRTGTTWTQETYIKAAHVGQGDQFGRYVALNTGGTVLAVGAPHEDSSARCVGGDAANDAAPQSGAVYRFTRANGSWTQTNYVKAANTEADDYFGRVALGGNGSTLAAGAIGEDSNATGVNGSTSDNSSPWSGAVFVYSW